MLGEKKEVICLCGNEVRIINREPYWKIRGLKELVYILGSSDCLIRPNMEAWN